MGDNGPASEHNSLDSEEAERGLRAGPRVEGFEGEEAWRSAESVDLGPGKDGGEALEKGRGGVGWRSGQDGPAPVHGLP